MTENERYVDDVLADFARPTVRSRNSAVESLFDSADFKTVKHLLNDARPLEALEYVNKRIETLERENDDAE